MASARGGLVATPPQGKGRASDPSQVVCSYRARTVKSKLKGGNLGSWMATKDAPLNAADYVFPIEI